jgi:hypothetical protein
MTTIKFNLELNDDQINTFKEVFENSINNILKMKRSEKYETKEYMKKYFINNKDKLLEKIPCPECNKLISRCNISKHKKTHLKK